jgi:four helix bundle protein
MKGDDIAARLLEFTVGVLRLTTKLPANTAGRHIASQLVRSGTAGGANYEEARGAESRRDFVHKIRLAEKEVRESRYWLLVVERAGLVEADLGALLREAGELAAILAASAKTARSGDTR